ncbi:ATP-dependent nuclease [Methylibium petroleiphilum]|uniref:ATP-dependent nuclease n=1 Tax=Methylibium petroleiphilum TaxID=105560 RepID=UPI001AD25A77|nr:AAA family ATPase [Methylibium petroleiphilum]MBN9206956.1 AAA family ATPase [Methylibium petroleiphilum]
MDSEIVASAPSRPRVAINRLIFSDGTSVPIGPNDIVLVVGPNNAGKSAALRAIRDKLQNAAHVSPVLRSVELVKSGSLADFSSWLLGWTVKQAESQPDNPVFQALGHAMHQSQAQSDWQRADNVLGGLSRWFCHLLSADERLQICNPAGNIALSRDNPSHPFHFLQRDDVLESRLSAKFRKAFGVDLVVHRNAGGSVPVHVGQRPTPAAGEDRVSISYIQRLELLPTLHTQGDGMRSFAGVLLATSVGQENIMLIDEPEAFLHPPQARLLGTTLVLDKAKERQLFIATHSTDIVRGVLETESTDVRVVRIRRNGASNTIRLLSNERIKQLWGDPLLRYSNILDGLFHERVIVCEADADCRFYSAVLDAVIAQKGDDTRRPDLMFTHCGGKARLPVVIRALREVDVPVRAVADFDVLSEEQPLRAIAEALGVDWGAIDADWKAVKSAIDGRKPDLSVAEAKEEIDAVFAKLSATVFPPSARSAITTVLKRSSPWSQAKLVGKAFVPSGEPTRACDRLLVRLRDAGLCVVEVGELEGYVRSEGGHGPKWVNAVLGRPLASDPELESARGFVRMLADISDDPV